LALEFLNHQPYGKFFNCSSLEKKQIEIRPQS